MPSRRLGSGGRNECLAPGSYVTQTNWGASDSSREPALISRPSERNGAGLYLGKMQHETESREIATRRRNPALRFLRLRTASHIFSDGAVWAGRSFAPATSPISWRRQQAS